MEGNILHFYYGGVRLLMHVVGCGSSKMGGLRVTCPTPVRSEISFLHMTCMDLQQYAPPVSLAT
jgi:hypothetical protein